MISPQEFAKISVVTSRWVFFFQHVKPRRIRWSPFDLKPPLVMSRTSRDNYARSKVLYLGMKPRKRSLIDSYYLAWGWR